MIYDVAIIGSGFCGTLVAVNLARLAPHLTVALIERGTAHGPGLAYGTADPDHLLNVRAGQMGAVPDRPGDFWVWLQQKGHTDEYTKDDFVPRHLYGRYLSHLLAQSAHENLTLKRGRVTDIEKKGDRFSLNFDNGETLSAKKTVLALGNFPPEGQGADEMQNPYDPQVWQRIADDGDILIVGTGLTSLDLVVTLAKSKPRGVIHLLSRHGFLPREHTIPGAYDLPLAEYGRETSLLKIFRRLRRDITAAAAQAVPWHYVIDALRPLNQTLWQNLSPADRTRFMRHLRAYWDVHRHRCAGSIMDALRGLERSGRLQLHHGPLLSRQKTSQGWHIDWRPRGTDEKRSFDVAHIVSCTGPQSDFRKLQEPLVQNMLRRRLIAPDPLHLGIATTDNYDALGADGKPVTGLYALGSVLKGRLYESVAIPELRGQAADIAKILAA